MPSLFLIHSTSCLPILCRHEQEKKGLNEQLAKTMRLFQDQLAQTVKMAAMLQVHDQLPQHAVCNVAHSSPG
jgi:hypothetical protein